MHNLVSRLGLRAREAPESGITATIAYGRGKPGLIPLWAGEGDRPTPDFICEPAIRALRAGETFYTDNRGIPELRQALSEYYSRHFARPEDPQRYIVTGSGMQAIQLAIQATVDPGDEVVYLSPAWPNFPAALAISGGRPVPVTLDQGPDGWSLDLDRFSEAITPHTRAMFINSPGNPTGWTASRDELSALLAIARERGLWIIADEIYALFHYGSGRASSFLDLMDEDDRILFANSFSKNWAMTGWRIGWLGIHPSLQQSVENLVQYATSGVPQFLQRGAVAALTDGDEFVAQQVENAKTARGIACDRLLSSGRVKLSPPQGAFYLFFAVDGINDTEAAARRMIDEALVGLAPGIAFGPGGENCFRLCFHRRLDEIESATARLAEWIGKRI